MITLLWQDIAAWLTVAVAAGYLVQHFRRRHGMGPDRCSGCTHCPLGQMSRS